MTLLAQKPCRNRQGGKFTRRLRAFLTSRSRVTTQRAYPDRMRKILGLLLLLSMVTACVPNPPPGRGPNPTLTVSTVVSGLDHVWDIAFTPFPDVNGHRWMIFDERV